MLCILGGLEQDRRRRRRMIGARRRRRPRRRGGNEQGEGSENGDRAPHRRLSLCHDRTT
jgi:hypothetical protein